MSIICALFGHKPVENYSEFSAMGGGEYATDVSRPYTDGIGRQHIKLTVKCPRCGERYLGAMIHAHWITDAIAQQPRQSEGGGHEQ